MSHMDEILDRFGHEGDKVFYELYCQNNLVKFSKISVDEFEDIYYALFDDEITKFLSIKEEITDEFDIEEYEEYIDILLTELVGSAMEEYSYVRFLAEIPKSQWPDIIKENLECYQKKTKSQRIFDFYRDKVKLECKLK
jgi:hypothetical protein